MTSTLWFALTAGCVTAALFCIETTKITRGAGSWRRDEQLKYLAGVFIGWAMVSAAMGIAEVAS